MERRAVKASEHRAHPSLQEAQQHAEEHAEVMARARTNTTLFQLLSRKQEEVTEEEMARRSEEHQECYSRSGEVIEATSQRQA